MWLYRILFVISTLVHLDSVLCSAMATPSHQLALAAALASAPGPKSCSFYTCFQNSSHARCLRRLQKYHLVIFSSVCEECSRHFHGRGFAKRVSPVCQGIGEAAYLEHRIHPPTAVLEAFFSQDLVSRRLHLGLPRRLIRSFVAGQLTLLALHPVRR